jgi:SAM-dependent methyltransferase
MEQNPDPESAEDATVSTSPGPVPVLDEIRSYWDADAPTYDRSRGHNPKDPAVVAAWAASMQHLLPPAPSRVLDVGAGTGFLSLIAARLGHEVTALDLAPQMLDRLAASALREDLTIRTVVGPADAPPLEGFDAVMERHLLWTLPDPASALGSWRRAAPKGRLLLVESLWGSVDSFEAIRSRVVHTLKRLRREAPAHHSHYSGSLRDKLPLSGGTPPSRLVEMAAREGWRNPRLERLRDVEWAELCELPLPERIVGVSPRFVVVAE